VWSKNTLFQKKKILFEQSCEESLIFGTDKYVFVSYFSSRVDLEENIFAYSHRYDQQMSQLLSSI